MKLCTLLLSASLLIGGPLLAQAPAGRDGGPRPAARDAGPEGRGPMGHRGPGDMGPGRHGMEGTWWKNPDIAKAIDLSQDQSKRIDDMFLKSRIQLIHMHASLEEEELILDSLMNANPLDAGKAGAQIDKIADTRASLEKANARMLLDIRTVLTAAQWSKLQDVRTPHRMHHDAGQMGRPNGQPPTAPPAQAK